MRILILLFVFAQIHQFIEASNLIWSQATPWYFSEDQGGKNNFTDEIVRLVDDLRSDHFSVVDLGNRWWQHQQFGTFWKSRCKGWYYHLDQGWIYVDKWSDSGTWMYLPLSHDTSANTQASGFISEVTELGWMWTQPEWYPSLYNDEIKDWLYFSKDRNESEYWCYALQAYLADNSLRKISLGEEYYQLWESNVSDVLSNDKNLSFEIFSDGTTLATYGSLFIPKEELLEDSNLSVIINNFLLDENVRRKKGILNIHESEDTYEFELGVNSEIAFVAGLASTILSNNPIVKDVPAYNADDILNQSYIDELPYFLDNYNILGQNGSELLSFINDGNSITKENHLSGYIKYLAAYTGSRTFGDDFDTTVADIPLDNVTLLPGSNFNISGEHDVSSLIAPAPLTNNNVDSDDIKILVAGSAKDFTITGDLTIHNENKVEDHALVLAAADDFYLRSEYSSENGQDYTNPETINLEYTGSNLAISSQDTMVLVNANIKTGGNLAIGTLDELHIGLADDHHSIITLGEGGNTPSPDNLYLYANDLISVNGLNIEGYVSKVYMEAETPALRGVMFPDSSRVMLRSKVGELNFNPTPTPIAGHVNLYNTGHESIRGGADLVRSDFEGSIGHYNSVEKHPNGEPYISVRAQ